MQVDPEKPVLHGHEHVAILKTCPFSQVSCWHEVVVVGPVDADKVVAVDVIVAGLVDVNKVVAWGVIAEL